MDIGVQYQPFLNGMYEVPRGRFHYKARPGCQACGSTGERAGQDCECTLFNIFRECLEHWRECDGCADPGGAEFRADLENVARRALSPIGYRLFRKMLTDPSAVTWREQLGVGVAVGRACVETQPYALYPIYDYHVPIHVTCSVK